MDDIERMKDLVSELQTLVADFDLDVHNDERNSDHIEEARAQLDNLETTIESLVP
jgi:hypothetical protein